MTDERRAQTEGLLLADKPAGVTSHDVVARLRSTLGRRRVGHAGTLDPFATGLLLILVGRATRIARFLTALPKSYAVVCRLGATSSTGDPEGEITLTGRYPPEGLELPTGTLIQRPPAYSAVHVDGERAHRRARRGESFQTPERTVTVYRFEQLWRSGDRAAFEIDCSAGTYVRSLIADLGDAYCEQLRRTAIGPFRVEDAWSASSAKQAPDLLTLAEALAFLPKVRLEGQAARRAGHGAAVGAPADSPVDPRGPVLLLDGAEVLGVAEPRAGFEGLELKPVVGLRG